MPIQCRNSQCPWPQSGLSLKIATGGNVFFYRHTKKKTADWQEAGTAFKKPADEGPSVSAVVQL